jgi:hypothetical protein
VQNDVGWGVFTKILSTPKRGCQRTLWPLTAGKYACN